MCRDKKKHNTHTHTSLNHGVFLFLLILITEITTDFFFSQSPVRRRVLGSVVIYNIELKIRTGFKINHVSEKDRTIHVWNWRSDAADDQNVE